MGSKGGHSAKQDWEGEERDYNIYMIDIDDRTIEIRAIQGIKKGQEICNNNESGIKYYFLLKVTYYPGEEKFSFDSQEERDVRLSKIRAKLQTLNVVFL